MMSTPVDLFQAGKLSEAVSAATDAVRSRPTDLNARSLLSELLCFVGDLERADKQLDAAIEVAPDSIAGTSLLRHLIRSELCRREVFNEGRVPEFLVQPSESQQNRLRAIMLIREQEYAEAAQLLSEAAEAELAVAGECDGNAFDEFIDLDDRLGPTIEVFTATGKYYWLSVEQVVSLEFSPIEHLSDMLWRRAEIETIGDVSGRVHVPALYNGSHLSDNDRLRIGRETDWIQENEQGPVCGLGQREWLVGEEAVAINQVQRLKFTH